jgi:hypothetical protein
MPCSSCGSAPSGVPRIFRFRGTYLPLQLPTFPEQLKWAVLHSQAKFALCPVPCCCLGRFFCLVIPPFPQYRSSYKPSIHSHRHLGSPTQSPQSTFVVSIKYAILFWFCLLQSNSTHLELSLSSAQPRQHTVSRHLKLASILSDLKLTTSRAASSSPPDTFSSQHNKSQIIHHGHYRDGLRECQWRPF